MPVVHIILVVLLTGAAVAVRAAGDSRVLNFVDYTKVTDRPALHAWVGNRLLLLSACTALVGALAWFNQQLAFVLLLVQVALVFVGIIAVVAGSTKFAKSAIPRSAA